MEVFDTETRELTRLKDDNGQLIFSPLEIPSGDKRACLVALQDSFIEIYGNQAAVFNVETKCGPPFIICEFKNRTEFKKAVF